MPIVIVLVAYSFSLKDHIVAENGAHENENSAVAVSFWAQVCIIVNSDHITASTCKWLRLTAAWFTAASRKPTQ